MFTGLIREVGRVKGTAREGGLLRLVLEAPRLAGRLGIGDSLAVNGCCLTVVKRSPPRLEFQVVPESLARTLLGRLRPGDPVNLEPSLASRDPLGGHFVQGHVDGVGRIVRLEREGKGRRMTVALPAGLARYIVQKGSIALDGVSLTIASVRGRSVEVALIPHTLRHTNLGAKGKGDGLHVEVDLLAKYLEKLLRKGRRSSTAKTRRSRRKAKGKG